MALHAINAFKCDLYQDTFDNIVTCWQTKAYFQHSMFEKNNRGLLFFVCGLSRHIVRSLWVTVNCLPRWHKPKLDKYWCQLNLMKSAGSQILTEMHIYIKKKISTYGNTFEVCIWTKTEMVLFDDIRDSSQGRTYWHYNYKNQLIICFVAIGMAIVM